MVIDWTSIASTLAVAGIGWVIEGVRRVNSKLASLNGSVGELKQWADDHEQLDNQRFETLSKRRKR